VQPADAGPSARETGVPLAPLVAMLAGMLVLVASVLPQRAFARLGVQAPERARAVALGLGLCGLVLGFVLLLALA
jgi:hypothetical protein